MRILALEASTEVCSVALMDGSEVTSRVQESGRAQASGILAWVQSLLAEAGTALSALDAIAASVGPGAFTGVRVSVAVAQGLAFGADIPVVPIMTLESLAFRAIRRPSSGATSLRSDDANSPWRALACLDARMGEVYWGCFADDAVRGIGLEGQAGVGPPATMVLALERCRHRGIGRGFAAYPELAELAGVELRPEDALALPDAADAAMLGALRLSAGEAIDPANLSPVYLRDKVALTEAERRGK